MKLTNIQIKNFRNLQIIEYKPHASLNIFTGKNAQGKTSFLESLYIASTGNSFRAANDSSMVKYNENGYYLKNDYLFMQRDITTELTYIKNINRKTFKINNKKTSYNNDDRLKVILFVPEDLYLIKGSPSKRRSFINFTLKQLSNNYAFNLDNYVKILNKRNLFLKNEQTRSKTFFTINNLFIENAVKLIIQRINFINIINNLIKPIHKELNKTDNNINVKYALSFEINNDKINVDILKDEMQKNLQNIKDLEIKRKKTMLGPHLDDIHFYQNGKLARLYASQGQQRNIVISLKLAEMHAFEKLKGYFPIFLLDEVLAELDSEKKELLIKYLNNVNFQTFLTSVNNDFFNIANNKIYVFDEGKLLRKEF